MTKLSKGIEFLFKKNKVETLQGYGRLAGPGRITVTDAKGQKREIQAAKIVLATGSEAKTFPGFEPDGKTILTNKEILALPALPKSMVIMGAGAVGVEFASIFHRFGVKVTILEMLPRAVPSKTKRFLPNSRSHSATRVSRSRRRPKSRKPRRRQTECPFRTLDRWETSSPRS